MDGLTTNGVLVMHPTGGFSEDSAPGVWREISVCGNVYALRDSRSAQQRGNPLIIFVTLLCTLSNCSTPFLKRGFS
uniref:Pellino FHA domain-containing protein n=1 Tax=Gopherus agassizii TaxID=38772 RepID=A0A452H254_9SAUR